MTLRLHVASFAARAVTIVTSAFRLYDRNSRSEKYRVFAWTTSRCIPATTSSSSTAGTPSSECSTSGCELLIFSEQHWTLRLFLLFHLGWRGARAVAVATASRLEICWFMLVVNVSLNAEYHLCSGVGRIFPAGGNNSEFFRGGSKGYSSIGAQQWRDFIFLTRTEHKKKFYYKFNRNISHFKPGDGGAWPPFRHPRLCSLHVTADPVAGLTIFHLGIEQCHAYWNLRVTFPFCSMFWPNNKGLAIPRHSKLSAASGDCCQRRNELKNKFRTDSPKIACANWNDFDCVLKLLQLSSARTLRWWLKFANFGFCAKKLLS